MILVTMAGGNVGLPLVEYLHAAGLPVRASTLEADQERLPAGVDAVLGDLAGPHVLHEAFTGVDALFLATGHPADEEPILTQAERAGVRRVVLLSSFSAGDLPDSPVGAEFRRIEEAVRSRDFAWTILRPQGFASTMVSLGWLPMFRQGRVRAPFGSVPVPIIHPADIASVAYTALTEDEGHQGRIYELTGPDALTLPEQVGEIAAAAGRDIAFEEIPVDVARRELQAFAPAMVVDYFLDVWTAVRPEVRDTVEKVTGRPARTFRQWAQENADTFRQAAVCTGNSPGT
ncbi:NAD(P)H-binding protein [Phytoactinopolyspora halotolerans]|uniref:NAD(P)H-binding protein n=1 Tax=Phytoactinopolyspora halotolerans TaxID=1981512 RepID=A0A6L9SK82_9ACTN|nr:NAD(P)H-binding protein [Phytoactinopolyspora halotolerans]NEE04741.1 NAD(P)H-binding protein [Phytoactinopolyspora halotolerans]